MSIRDTLAVPLAWRQLRHEPGRLVAAVAGIAFAVVLVFLQLGFHTALFESNVRIHERLIADLVLVSPRSTHLAASRSFPRRRAYQALGVPGVESVSVLRVGMTRLEGRDGERARDVLVVGIDPARQTLDVPGIEAYRTRVRFDDTFVFDRAARPEFAAITHALESGRTVRRELGNRRVELAGLFTLGTSFGIDAVLVTSDANFRRVVPLRTEGQAEVGLVTLDGERDAAVVREQLRRILPADVDVLTKAEFVESEKAYWRVTTPIGYIISLSVIMGWVIGAVFVYQILFTSVATNLSSYATLKAMGFSDGWLVAIVLEKALILAALGFVPGLVVAAAIYRIAGEATRLPMDMTIGSGLLVLVFTMLMCSAAGLFAARRLRTADPAELL